MADQGQAILTVAGEAPGIDGPGSQWGPSTSATDPDLSNGVTESEDTSNPNSGSSSGNGGSSASNSDSDSASQDSGAATVNAAFGTVAMAAFAVLALMN